MSLARFHCAISLKVMEPVKVYYQYTPKKEPQTF